MPKLKTRKAVSKRFKVTAKKAVTRRQSKQNHFNSRQTPDKKRLKRTDQTVPKTQADNILRELPYI
jgi:large subunit ribosomal protein L35